MVTSFLSCFFLTTLLTLLPYYLCYVFFPVHHSLTMLPHLWTLHACVMFFLTILLHCHICGHCLPVLYFFSFSSLTFYVAMFPHYLTTLPHFMDAPCLCYVFPHYLTTLPHLWTLPACVMFFPHYLTTLPHLWMFPACVMFFAHYLTTLPK